MIDYWKQRLHESHMATARTLRYQRSNLAKGLCRYCTNEVETGHGMCSLHLAKARSYAKEYRKLRKEYKLNAS